MRILIDLAAASPALGIALDEAFLESVRTGAEGILRIWVNDRAAVIGRSQSLRAEVDLDAATALGIPAIRRISGGGAVYHYPGNMNISLIGSFRGSVGDIFRRCGERLADGVAALGLPVSPLGSSLLWGGRKIGGAAQARRGSAVLYHSTLLVEPADVPMDRILRAMQPGYRSDAVRSRPAETIPLAEACRRPIPLEEAADAIVGRLAAAFADGSGRRRVAGPYPEEVGRARRLAEAKYGDPAWNQSV